ncbi:MAG: LysM peptidoglycan-binding domain-containing protein [Deltaproteobacteria bacterium]|jgi:LysM repeat protein|nr:LysM peptidoglycan-binding domain-containing protein [Deltaproteobacteria bacterium]
MIFLGGCSSVSDEELTRLREETYALEAELAVAKREAAILDRVLTKVYQERDRLVDQIARATAESQGLEPPSPISPAISSAISPGLPISPGAPATPTAKPTRYRAQSGDTLSTIAQRFGTTVSVLLELNPHISRRSNQMVWVDDEVVLPR